MATIYKPIRPDGVLTREERLANTEPNYPPREAPLTPAQLDELRAKAPSPDRRSHNAKAAADIAERQARQRAHDDKRREALRAAEEAKGAPLTFAEREIALKSAI